MSLSRDEVLHIAKLSRLEFTDSEIEKFQIDLNNILKYIDVLSEVDTDNVEPLTEIQERIEEKMREDIIKPSLTSEEAMKNSPLSDSGALIVPKMVGEN